jgi:hypothetical protein
MVVFVLSLWVVNGRRISFLVVVVVANLVVRRRGIDTLLRRAEGRDFHDS